MTVTTRVTGGQHIFTWDLTVKAPEIERWRNNVASAVQILGGDPDAVAVGRLGASELLSNVCKHVKDLNCRLLVERDHNFAYVRVFDHSPEVPAITFPSWGAEAGRGLWLLREMADDFGYTCTPTGKWVWFRCPLAQRSEVAAK